MTRYSQKLAVSHSVHTLSFVQTILIGNITGSTSLAEKDFAAGAHVGTCLGGSLVRTSLEADDGLASLQLFIGEVALAFIRGLGP